jgi:hypothetical protein
MYKTTSTDLLAAAEAKAAEMVDADVKALCKLTNFSETTVRALIANAFMHGALWQKRESQAEAVAA